MRGLLRLLTVTAIVMMVGSAGLATPSVQLTFDPVMYAYTYRVTLLAGSGDDLNQFTIDAFTEGSTSYTMASVVNIDGTSSGWLPRRTTWYDQNNLQWYAYQWWNGNANRGGLGWVGEFKLTIPDSHVVDGYVVTKPQYGSSFNHELQVPMLNSLPEPSSIMGLGAMLLGMAPFLGRMRKR